MDIERGIARAFFYDYPIEKAWDMLEKGSWDDFLTPLPDLLKWQMRAFDVGELRQIWEVFQCRWITDYAGYPTNAWPLLYMKDMAGDLLVKVNNAPRVKQDGLLRWRMISQSIGEDLLTLTWLAGKEKNNITMRDDFVWEDTIKIEDKSWKDLMGNNPLYDIHSHIGASSDAFNIRWIYWMNNWDECVVNEKEPINDMFIALAIRYDIFALVKEGTAISEDRINQFVKARKDVKAYCKLVNDSLRDVVIAKRKGKALGTTPEKQWDYALGKDIQIVTEHESSPYMLHGGERWLMYHYLCKLYQQKPEAVAAVPLFYMYLLIKMEHRKNYIHSNNLLGLSNLQDYENQNREDKIDKIAEVRKRYAIQTALGDYQGKNYLETRIKWTENPKSGKQVDVKMECSIFGQERKDRKKLLQRVRLVVSYNKRYATYTSQDRESKLFKQKEQFDQIYQHYTSNKRKQEQSDFCVVGIDFTGSDELARPEVYSQLIRYARAQMPTPFKWFTYHAGEDFYDLVDGLRTIDEILVYLKWDKNCRLAHCLALATDPTKYYDSRGWNIIITRQMLLDNLTWLWGNSERIKYPLRKVDKETLLSKARELYELLGYTKPFDINAYWKSMRLRGDHPMGGSREKDKNLFSKAALDPDVTLGALRADPVVSKMFKDYYDDDAIKERGRQIVNWKMPRDLVGLIKRLQKDLMTRIKKEKIAIETCPTSNCLIGYFDKYIDLPLFKFIKEFPKNKISINTDDKGIMATSIENEFAIIAQAMKKDRRYSGKSQEILERLRIGGRDSRFRV